ncbi:MAG: hypothetical protein DRI57_20995 [Deltaproteobacteria bacterium]|nr:MAG: hypothetical protein DRI57_20995 [Deltaproteobacteria bacterium]
MSKGSIREIARMHSAFPSLFTYKENDMTKIRTSDRDWFKEMAKAYKRKDSFLFTDDAVTGINPAYSTLLEMGKQAGLDAREWLAVLASLGMAGAGVWAVRAAILDPEPTSKLTLMIGGGAACLIGGGFSAIRILTGHCPPNISVSPDGMKIAWDR